MAREVHIPLFDLISSLSDTADMISPALANHHLQVTYIAHCLGVEMGLTESELRDLVIAGALHDVGAFSLQERMDMSEFEVENPMLHCKAGSWLLQTFDHFKDAANLVRYHHVHWDNGAGAESDGLPVPFGSHILHLADRAAILISEQRLVLPHIRQIKARLFEQTNTQFHPDIVEAFKRTSRRDNFWLDASSRSILAVMRLRVAMDDLVLDTSELLQLAEFFRRLIDFRSPFTASHSSGVAASAEALARLNGFTPDDALRMRVAAYLHDLGKLAIPREVLEKPAPLSADEFAVMEAHVYYTFRILEPIADLRVIREWSAFHQERLDGSGYPFHLTGADLSTGSRILAVADVFTALTEDRPYRDGMPLTETMQVLQGMGERRELDTPIIQVLMDHLDAVNNARLTAQKESHLEYGRFIAALN